jgi:DNA-binding CsgD family transcriptional regulator
VNNVQNPWVDELLSRWGRWAIRCESGALGFAASSILAGSDAGSGLESRIPLGVMNDDLEAVDGSIRKLPKVLNLTIVEVYMWSQGKSERVIADNLGIHVQTMRKYIFDAHRKIALDLVPPCAHNPLHSANQDSCIEGKQPATA